ncbi:MAG: ribosome biogenesis GTPase YlqF [Vulcanimicrobiota bacterium]
MTKAFSWYPGHMARARRRLEGNLKLADAVLTVLDCRIPATSRHLELEASLAERNMPILLVLNKADLADPQLTKRWLEQLKREGVTAVAMSSQQGRGAGPLRPHLDRLREKVAERFEHKGVRARDPRLLVVGLPNVGKSSLLNRLVGKSRAKTGRKPGVTRGAQWVVAQGKWQVLDTPGILYPRIETEQQLAYLAAVGCVKRDVLPFEDVARHLLMALVERDLAEPMLGEPPYPEPHLLIEALARQKGFLLKGGRLDIERATTWLLAQFFEGKVGPVTLEAPCA